MDQSRPIRSFVKRQRKLSNEKQVIFDELWSKYVLDLSTEYPYSCCTHLTLEIGFGNGETIFNLAQKYPERSFIGIEVYQPGIANLLSLLKKQPLNNIRIYYGDAVTVLDKCFLDYTLDIILILFPDPWPKTRHHKRRLIQQKFIELLQKKLKPTGILKIITDLEDYAKHIIKVLSKNQNFKALDQLESLPMMYDQCAQTKFGQRGKIKGHQIFELLFATSGSCKL